MKKFICKKCGKCCGLVMITKKEEIEIKEYCKEHNIKPIKRDSISLDCIFLSDTQCLIYDVRPSICRKFQCNTLISRLERLNKPWTYQMLLNNIKIP